MPLHADLFLLIFKVPPGAHKSCLSSNAFFFSPYLFCGIVTHLTITVTIFMIKLHGSINTEQKKKIFFLRHNIEHHWMNLYSLPHLHFSASLPESSMVPYSTPHEKKNTSGWTLYWLQFNCKEPMNMVIWHNTLDSRALDGAVQNYKSRLQKNKKKNRHKTKIRMKNK